MEISRELFKLKEEQKERIFSQDGNFVWNKREETKDAWVDGIDWVKVKPKSKAELEQEENDDEAEDTAHEVYNETGNYKQLVEVVGGVRKKSGGNKGLFCRVRI